MNTPAGQAQRASAATVKRQDYGESTRGAKVTIKTEGKQMGIYDLAAQQNRANRVYSYIESADQDDLMQVIAAIMDRLDEVDADGLASAWEHLDSALTAIKQYDPRHEAGCDCRECNDARTEHRLNVYFDNVARQVNSLSIYK